MIQANIYQGKSAAVPPTPSLIITGPDRAYGISTDSFIYTVTYSNVTTVNLQNSDITIGGTDHAGCGAVVTNGTTTTATVTVTGCTGDGTMNFTVAANTAEDAEGNKAPASSVSNDAAITHSFVVTFDTTKPGSANDTVVLPFNGWNGYNFTVYWGDGDDDTFTGWMESDPAVTHQYAAPGVYDIKIKGTLPEFRFAFGGNNIDKLKIINIKQWGTFAWENMQGMFHQCANLEMTAPDRPDLSGVTDMRAMFQGATIFNGKVDHWITTNVTDMSNVFASAKAFNQPVNTWDTSNVTTMNSMFGGTDNFNQSLADWNTANVVDMSNMFLTAKAFNQPLVRNGNKWNTSNVTAMFGMFEDTAVFNQDLSSWDVSKVGVLDQMFKSALAFDQDLSMWVLRTIPSGPTHLYFDQGAAFDGQTSKMPVW